MPSCRVQRVATTSAWLAGITCVYHVSEMQTSRALLYLYESFILLTGHRFRPHPDTGAVREQGTRVTTDAFDAREVFATKADLFATRTELKDEIGIVKDDLLATRAELKDDLLATRAELKDEIRIVKADLVATRSELKEEIGQVRADLIATRSELKEEIGDVRVELLALRAEFKEDIGTLRAELHQMEARLIRWMAGILVAGMVAAATISRLIA